MRYKSRARDRPGLSVHCQECLQNNLHVFLSVTSVNKVILILIMISRLRKSACATGSSALDCKGSIPEAQLWRPPQTNQIALQACRPTSEVGGGLDSNLENIGGEQEEQVASKIASTHEKPRGRHR